MKKDEIQIRLKAIVKNYLPEDVSENQINPDSNLINELNINSANMVDVALDVEDEFDIELDNEDMEKMVTLEGSVEIISQKLLKK